MVSSVDFALAGRCRALSAIESAIISALSPGQSR